MRSFIRLPALVVTSASLLAIAGGAFALQVTNYRNLPGPVTGSYQSGIKGTFRLQPVAAPAGIPSPPSGGACIVFRARDLGFEKMDKKRCTKDSQCSTPGENSTGYCHQPTNKCWSRPTVAGADALLCKRAVSSPIGQAIAISATPAPISTPSWKVKPHAKARVLSCLNRTGGLGCRTGATPYVYEWSTPKQL